MITGRVSRVQRFAAPRVLSNARFVTDVSVSMRVESRLRRGRRLPIPMSVLTLRPRHDAPDFGSTD
jgi:hypothetical protein